MPPSHIGKFDIIRNCSIRLGRIVRVLEAGQALVQCFDPTDKRCTLLPGCRLRAELAGAEAAFLAHLDHSTSGRYRMACRAKVISLQ
jgi:DNA-binding IscR family transcriptional regulator